LRWNTTLRALSRAQTHDPRPISVVTAEPRACEQKLLPFHSQPAYADCLALPWRWWAQGFSTKVGQHRHCAFHWTFGGFGAGFTTPSQVVNKLESDPSAPSNGTWHDMARSDEAQAFFYAVYAAVQEVPHGKVTTYGHIALLIGMRELHFLLL